MSKRDLLDALLQVTHVCLKATVTMGGGDEQHGKKGSKGQQGKEDGEEEGGLGGVSLVREAALLAKQGPIVQPLSPPPPAAPAAAGSGNGGVATGAAAAAATTSTAENGGEQNDGGGSGVGGYSLELARACLRVLGQACYRNRRVMEKEITHAHLLLITIPLPSKHNTFFPT